MDSEFWTFISVFSLIVISLKIYLGYGFRQVLGGSNKKWIALGTLLSIASYVVGIFTMVKVFGDDTILNMKFLPNFIIALMMSVLICELVLFGFYFLDDVLRFGNFAFRKITNRETSEKTDGKSRRRFLKTAGTVLTAIPFASFLHGITIGKYSYKIFKQELAFPDLPSAFDGLKIVQFSDLHSGSFDSLENVKRGIELMQSENPDLIFFTGDLVNEDADEVLPYKDFFKKLSAPLGKFSVMGNHDYPFRRNGERAKGKVEKIAQHHKDMNFRLLKNESVEIQKGADSIRLVGVENWSRDHYFGKHGDLNKAVEACDKGDFTILLSHDPTHWDEQVKTHDHHFHLTLSGHTHGMQMGIELEWFKFSPAQFKFSKWAGLYQELGQYLYINRGFGFLGFAGRVGIPPEITVFELRKA